MKRIKNHSLKIAILLIVLGSMAILYWLYPSKHFDNKTIPENADAIAMVDIKTIRNYFIFSYLKNPSQWELGTKNSANKKRFELSDYGLETPDYLTLFHVQNQPLNQWSFVAIIENEIQFENALIKAQFIKTKSKKSLIAYYSKTSGVYIIRHANQILFCNNALNNQQNCIQTAEDLFIKHSYFDSKKTDKILESRNAVTIWFQKNNLLDEDGIIHISLKDHEIVAEGKLNWKPSYRKSFTFNQDSNALLSLGFNLEMFQNQEIIKRNVTKINKMIGFNLDSILAHHPTQTELLLHNIIEKKDSAITYDYDDDFNPIKKVVIHSSREPSFYFSIRTDDSKKVYDYLKSQNAIDEHQVFVNFPLALTKTFVKNNSLTLEANLPKTNTSKPTSPKIGYLQINFSKLQPKDWNYLIGKNKNFEFLKPFETLEMNLTVENNSGYFHASIKSNKSNNILNVIN